MASAGWNALPVEDLDDSTRVLARRLRIALLGWLAPIFLFGLADLYLAHQPGALATLFALKVVGIAAVVLAVLALRSPRPWRSVIAIALLSVALIYALSTVSAIIDRETSTIPILSLAGALATATLLPWGVAPQLVVVALAALSPLVTSYYVHGSVAEVITYPNVGLVIGLAVSVWVAAEFQRSRLALLARNRERRRADEAVRQLNEALEQRVAERTAALERANQALQQEIAVRVEAEHVARQHQAELTHVLRLSTMGEMAAGLAHEINQPLAAIVNYAHGCARRLRRDPAQLAAVLPVIDDIAAEALRAGEIIRRLRSLVRKETPRQDWIDLGDVAAQIIRLVHPEALQHEVEVRLDGEPELPAVVGDRIQIEQVVLNLLRNAIDAMATVTGPRELHVRVGRAAGEAVELAVRDTGPGMPAAIAERVFDPFFSTKPGGLGMGLSISRSIVEAHRGELSVTPNLDCGVTFRVRLPVSTPAPSLAAAGG